MSGFDEFATRERAGWADRGIVSAYVEKFGPVTDRIARDLVRRGAPRGKAVLDLCCGQGALTAMLCHAGAQVYGLDFSPEMLARAAETAPDAVLLRGDAAALPFDGDQFDLVFCNFGIMHLPDQPKALSEVRRVLRPSGQFLLATWAAPPVSPAFGTVFGAIKRHADLSQAPVQPDLFALATPEGASETLAAAGLKVVSHDLVPAAWSLADPAELFEIFLTATVAASQLIKGQRPETVEAIRAEITSAVAERFGDGAGYRVPVPVAVVVATA